jgi:hypothetical protein
MKLQPKITGIQSELRGGGADSKIHGDVAGCFIALRAASLSSRVTTVTIFCFRLCALGSLVRAKHAQILPSGIAAEVILYQCSSFRF